MKRVYYLLLTENNLIKQPLIFIRFSQRFATLIFSFVATIVNIIYKEKIIILLHKNTI